jgi:hypothetical protein
MSHEPKLPMRSDLFGDDRADACETLILVTVGRDEVMKARLTPPSVTFPNAAGVIFTRGGGRLHRNSPPARSRLGAAPAEGGDSVAREHYGHREQTGHVRRRHDRGHERSLVLPRLSRAVPWGGGAATGKASSESDCALERRVRGVSMSPVAMGNLSRSPSAPTVLRATRWLGRVATLQLKGRWDRLSLPPEGLRGGRPPARSARFAGKGRKEPARSRRGAGREPAPEPARSRTRAGLKPGPNAGVEIRNVAPVIWRHGGRSSPARGR